MIKLSIIIPVYNVKLYLKDCVDSVLNQNYKDCEILLIDDGSTDGSQDICDNYEKKYPNIVKVIHKKNEGPGEARNVGIINSKGKYIVFLDSDDMLIKDSLENIDNIIGNENYDVLLGQEFKILFPRGTMENRVNLIKFDLKSDDILKSIFKYSTISITYVWRNIYNADFIKRNKIFFEKDILCSEDLDWNTRIFLKTEKVGKLDFFTHIYRGNRKESIVTAASFQRVNDFYTIVNKWLKDNSIEDEEANMLIKKFYANGFYSNLKFIYNYSKKERNILINRIAESDFWKFYNKKNKTIYIARKIFGLKATLLFLNIKYRIFLFAKKSAIKFELIDR